MGLFDRLSNWLGLKKREASVLVIGLNNSGKSTLVDKFKPEERRVHHSTPTVGFNVEKFQSNFYNNIAFSQSMCTSVNILCKQTYRWRSRIYSMGHVRTRSSPLIMGTSLS